MEKKKEEEKIIPKKNRNSLKLEIKLLKRILKKLNIHYQNNHIKLDFVILEWIWDYGIELDDTTDMDEDSSFEESRFVIFAKGMFVCLFVFMFY